MYLHQAERLLTPQGWRLERVTGSHRHHRNRQGQRLTVAAHGQRLAIDPDTLRRDLQRLAEERTRMRSRLIGAAHTAQASASARPASPCPRVRVPARCPAQRPPAGLLVLPGRDAGQDAGRVEQVALRKARAAFEQEWNPWDFPEPLVIAHWLRSRHAHQRRRGDRCAECGWGAADWVNERFCPTPADWNAPVTDEWVLEEWREHHGERPEVHGRALLCGRCIIHALERQGVGVTARWSESPWSSLPEFILAPQEPDMPRAIAGIWRPLHDNEYLFFPSNRFCDLPYFAHLAFFPPTAARGDGEPCAEEEGGAA